jgi:hypothetical protein
MTPRLSKKRALGALVLSLAAAWVAPVLAQTKTGTTMGAFLQIEPSGRLSAMGNAGVAMADGLDAVYYNAASIADVDHYQVTFTHSAWLADIRYDYVAGSIPIGKSGSGYAAVTSLNSGEMIVRTVEQPLGTGERFTVSDVAIALGYGQQITDRFAAGGQVTYAQESIWHSTAATLTFSVGTLYQVADNGLHIGACLSNFGTQMGYDGRDLRITYDQDPSRNGDNGTLPGEVVTGDFPVPILFRVGIGAPFQLSQNTRLNLEADALHPNDNSGSMSFGSELLLNHQFALRAGFQNAFQTDSEEGLTAGAGFENRYGDIQYHIDYAWADHGRLGSVSRFTLGFGF